MKLLYLNKLSYNDVYQIENWVNKTKISSFIIV